MPEELGDFIEAAGLGSYDPDTITKIYRKKSIQKKRMGYIKQYTTNYSKKRTYVFIL